MLRLASVEPQWHTLFPAVGDQPAVEALFAPITMPDVRAARRALAQALDLHPDNFEVAGDALSAELIRRTLRDWRGVGDLDGKPLDPADPVNVAAFVADDRTFQAADTAHVKPWLARHSEGNAWSASPNGTGEAEMPATGTASSAAPLAAADPDAAPTPKTPSGSVRTARTSRKRKKGSGSGMSSPA